MTTTSASWGEHASLCFRKRSTTLPRVPATHDLTAERCRPCWRRRRRVTTGFTYFVDAATVDDRTWVRHSAVFLGWSTGFWFTWLRPFRNFESLLQDRAHDHTREKFAGCGRKHHGGSRESSNDRGISTQCGGGGPAHRRSGHTGQLDGDLSHYFLLLRRTAVTAYIRTG
jgi:hypothetical protein